MASSTATSGVYIQVIEDVINNVRNDFLNNGGPGHGVLLQLQGLWEAKMMQVGGGVITPVYDLNVPYGEYETPTTDLLFPPTPMQTPLPGSGETPFPGTAELCNIPTEYPSENSEVPEMKLGRPSQLMEFFMISSGKRKRDALTSENINGYIPQQDGSGDAISDESKLHVTQNDVFDDDNEDTADEPLNENDDDLDDVDEREDLNTQRLVLAQFDKVDHNKGRWKCTLKDGIMHINQKDILFNKANGQFVFQ